MSVPTTEKLAMNLERQQRLRPHPLLPLMIQRAREGYYDDYKSPLATPSTQLVEDLFRVNAWELRLKAIAGEFDATREESDAWAASPEGQATIAEFTDHLGRMPIVGTGLAAEAAAPGVLKKIEENKS